MTKIVLLTLLCLVLILVAIAGAWPSFRKGGRDTIGNIAMIGDPLAAGVFLGAGLIHLLPRAVAGFDTSQSAYSWAFILAGTTMLILGWMDPGEGHGDDRENGLRNATPPIVATAALAIHSLLAGSALGAQRTDAAILVLFLALIAHKGSAAFALGRLLTNGSLSRTMAIASMGLFIAALPIGVALGVAITDLNQSDTVLVPIMLALGAGTFLHFATAHHRFEQEAVGFKRNAAVFAGFALMAGISFFG